ncbi:hypothetical protein EIN_055500 [Entamoeba invadens IP1]|uniref:hypothetical protein n=1 Tax=Entamoeba invadens IP1 TaxID=370355 RepID=UPI0002C3EEA0|nr:hypothetical protein EIN_055500 [Entamoeba invadens IP1]ELP93225.1 hypothetical protein EIN_055500 [Entamoeba invadens IP1]|eukprot:XP_004259996.1 hypothetical protein EIN_055500 [Entamoeba invadens IP1]
MSTSPNSAPMQTKPRVGLSMTLKELSRQTFQTPFSPIKKARSPSPLIGNYASTQLKLPPPTPPKPRATLQKCRSASTMMSSAKSMVKPMKHKLGESEKYQIVKYLKTTKDVISFANVTKSNQKVLSLFEYNPVPVKHLKLFPNMDVLLLYNPTDFPIISNQVSRVIKVTSTSLTEALELAYENIEVYSIEYSSEDVAQFGPVIPEICSAIGDNCFSDSSTLRFVPFPPNVHRLGNFSFARCNLLTTVVIPSTITKLGNGCFYQCTNLEKIYLHCLISKIGEDCFSYCEKLREIVVDLKYNYFNADVPCWIGEIIEKSGKKCMKKVYTKYDREKFGITKPEDVFELGEFCYSKSGVGNEALLNVKVVGNHCFELCCNLRDITISNEIERLGYSAFALCTNLTKIDFSQNTAKQLPGSLLCECCQLQEIVFNSEIERIEGRCFYGCVSLEHIELPNTVSYLGEMCFSQCKKLKEIVIGERMRELGYSCFSECYMLADMKMEEIEIIPESCFEQCRSLIEVKMGNAVLIQKSAFKNCSQLRSITVDWGQVEIEPIAFDGCQELNSNIKDIVIEKQNESLFGHF